jgi:hypothetical protein
MALAGGPAGPGSPAQRGARRNGARPVFITAWIIGFLAPRCTSQAPMARVLHASSDVHERVTPIAREEALRAFSRTAWSNWVGGSSGSRWSDKVEGDPEPWVRSARHVSRRYREAREAKLARCAGVLIMRAFWSKAQTVGPPPYNRHVRGCGLGPGAVAGRCLFLASLPYGRSCIGPVRTPGMPLSLCWQRGNAHLESRLAREEGRGWCELTRGRPTDLFDGRREGNAAPGGSTE